MEISPGHLGSLARNEEGDNLEPLVYLFQVNIRMAGLEIKFTPLAPRFSI